MKKIVYITILSLNLTSCATYNWVSDKKSADFLERDRTQCNYWAFEKFPPLLGYATRTDYVPINYYTNHRSLYLPYTNIVTVDINVNARQNAFDKCMMENSWRYVRVK